MSKPEGFAALKPCPFCGGAPFLDNLSENRRGPRDYYVRCTICEVQQIVDNESRAAAIAAWNLRSGDRDATLEECAKVALADYPLHARVDGYKPGIKVAIASAIRALRRAGEPT